MPAKNTFTEKESRFKESVSGFKTGREIVTEAVIMDFQLFDFVKNGLQPYTMTGSILESPALRGKRAELALTVQNLKRLTQERDTKFRPITMPKGWVPDKKNPKDVMIMNTLIYRTERKEDLERLESKIEELKVKAEDLEKELDRTRSCSWKEYQSPEDEKARRRFIDELLNSFYRKADFFEFPELIALIREEPSPLLTVKHKLRPSQKHREECRKIAKGFWDEEPSITISEIIQREEMVKASKKSNDQLYLEKTVRNWIKDLCPNRARGRRPNKK